MECDCLPVSLDAAELNDVPVLAVGFIDGSVGLYTINLNEDQPSTSSQSPAPDVDQGWMRSHKRAVRKLCFASTTTADPSIYTVTKNRALCQWDIETGSKKRLLRTAHEVAPWSICAVDSRSEIGAQCVASGDEDGVVKTWDFRAETPLICEFKEHEECVTDLTVCTRSNKLILLSTSMDGTLGAYDLKKRKHLMNSELMHSELLSVAIANGGQAFCGGADGYFEVFNFREYGNIKERLKSGHKESVDCVQVVADRYLVSGSTADGRIRITQLEPNKCSVGMLGRHNGGVEDMAVTVDERWIVSCGHDDSVSFWDINHALSRTAQKGKKRKLESCAINNFFEDLL